MLKVGLVIFTILVILIFLMIIASFIAMLMFRQKVKVEVKELFNTNGDNNKKIILKEDLLGLPPCVQSWLEHSYVIGRERISTVRLKQKGKMRTKEGQPWMPVEAEQYFTVEEPGFIWRAKVRMAPCLYFAGRDKYYEGKGNMLIKVVSLIPVVDAQGKEMDQGVLLRYLAEIMWFPTAALSSYIKWEEIDLHSARATMSYKGVTASGVFSFNELGDVINFVCQRYMEAKGQFSLETWSTPPMSYHNFDGIRIPNTVQAIWKLKTGDFCWFKGEVTEIEYNKPVIY